MNMSLGLLLVIGITILCGVFVLADSISPVTSGGKDVNQSVASTGNSSIQAELLVRFTPELWNTTALQYAAQACHTNIGATVITDYSDLGLPGLQLIELPPGMTTSDGILYYSQFPYVQYAEPNAVYSIENSANQTNQNASMNSFINSSTTDGSQIKLLVQFNVSAFSDPTTLADYAKKTHAALSTTILNDFTPEGLPGLYLVSLPVNMTAKDGIEAYKNQTSVLFAEPDYLIHVPESEKKV